MYVSKMSLLHKIGRKVKQGVKLGLKVGAAVGVGLLGVTVPLPLANNCLCCWYRTGGVRSTVGRRHTYPRATRYAGLELWARANCAGDDEHGTAVYRRGLTGLIGCHSSGSTESRHLARPHECANVL